MACPSADLSVRPSPGRRQRSVRAKPNRAIPLCYAEGRLVFAEDRGAKRAVMHRMSDLPKSEAAFELPSSRRYAVSDELRKEYFQKLIRGPAGRSDWRSSPPAEKWGVCIGATAPSQADMGIKARWRKRFHPSARKFSAHQPRPGSRPAARMSRFASSVAVNAMKARAKALFRGRFASPAA